MELHNLSKIVRINTYGMNKVLNATYSEYKSHTFWRKEIKEGFYSDYGFSFAKRYDTDSERYWIDNENCLWENTCVVLWFQGGIRKEIYFDSVKRSVDFVDKISNNNMVNLQTII